MALVGNVFIIMMKSIMKIKFNSDDELPLKKTVETFIITIVV